jgi:hypothetical protein
MDVSGTDLNAVWMELDGIDDYDGASGNWTININITTSNHQIVLDEIHICRVNSSYVNQETLTSDTGLNDSLGATGQISNVVNQASSTTITAGDKIIVIFAFDENQGMANSFAYTPDDTVEAPGTVSADISIPVPVGSLVLTGQTPLAVTGFVIGVPVGSLVLTGLTPALFTEFNALPGLGTLVLTGEIATLVQTDNHIRAPPVGSGVLTGLTPTTKMGVTIPVGVGSLILEGFPPPTVLQPSEFGLKLTGFTPSLEFSFTIPVPVGSLVVDGKIPTVNVTSDEDHIALPDTGTLVVTGEIPTATTTDNHVIAVPVGTLTLTGLAPVVVVSQTASPALGTLVLTGEIPTLVQTDNHIRAPPLGALDLTGQVPVALSGDDHVAQPGTGTLVVTGLAPTAEESHVISIPVGSLALTGQAPSTGGVAIEVPVGSLTLEGFPPPSVLQPSDFGLKLVGFIPTVSVGENHFPQPGTGTLTFNGEVPALEIVITNPESSLFLEGFAPTVTVTPNKFLKIPAGSLILNGFEPLLVIPQGSRGVQPGVGQLNLTGFDPTIYLSKYFPAKGTLQLLGFGPTVIVEEGVITPDGLPTTGWKFLMEFDTFRQKRDEEEEKRKKDLEQIKELEDTDRQIAELLQQDIKAEARQKEIKELERIIARNATAQDLIDAEAHNVAKAFARAALQKNFSAIEALEREMDRKIEEDEFLMLAMMIL